MSGQPRPVNAPLAVPLGIGVQPGTPNIIRARQVIVSGTNDGIFIYSGVPRAGNPPVFWAVAPGVTTDPYGNTVAAVMGAGLAAGARSAIDSAGRILQYDTSGALNAKFDPVAGTWQFGPGTALAPGTFIDAQGTQVITPNVGTWSPGTNTQEGWHALSLAAGWSNVAGFAPASYRLNALGNVEMSGRISGTITGTTAVGTLPTGYYSTLYARAYSVNVDASAGLTPSLTPDLRVDTLGNVAVSGLNNGAATVDLDGTFMLSAG